MKKPILLFLFTAVISLALSGIYISVPADEKPKSECPFLKSNSEITCPYLNEKNGQTESECPYLNGKTKSPSTEKESKSQQCPYLQEKENSVKRHKTINKISS